MTNVNAEMMAVLKFIGEQPDGSCRLNWFPDELSFAAYRDCRELGLVRQMDGYGGFIEARIMPAGRRAISKAKGAA